MAIIGRNLPHLPAGQVLVGHEATLYLLLPEIWNYIARDRPTMKCIAISLVCVLLRKNL